MLRQSVSHRPSIPLMVRTFIRGSNTGEDVTVEFIGKEKDASLRSLVLPPPPPPIRIERLLWRRGVAHLLYYWFGRTETFGRSVHSQSNKCRFGHIKSDHVAPLKIKYQFRFGDTTEAVDGTSCANGLTPPPPLLVPSFGPSVSATRTFRSDSLTNRATGHVMKTDLGRANLLRCELRHICVGGIDCEIKGISESQLEECAYDFMSVPGAVLRIRDTGYFPVTG